MVALVWLLALLLLLAPATIHVAGQKDFLSIDCGLDDSVGYTDANTGISYVPDGLYVDAGENFRMSAEYESQWARPYRTVRSFPSGVWNCYRLPTVADAKYLVRLEAVYGNHDGRNDSSSTDFDVHLGTNYWATVRILPTGERHETMFIAWASWAPICLSKTGRGVPFLSLLELRKLPDALYPPLTTNQAMLMSLRWNMGGETTFNRFDDDKYDRIWLIGEGGPQWRNRSGKTLTIQPDPSYDVPKAILQTAFESTGNDTTISYGLWQGASKKYKVFLHFADFQNTQTRQFDIYIDGNRLKATPYSPPYSAYSCVSNSEWFTYTGRINITLAATATSVLPSMLNALEVYSLMTFDKPITFPKDFDAIMNIKLEYGVKNWTGDPCFPSNWDGVACSNTSDNAVRIVSIDLSNSFLRGTISSNFALLTALENLNLSNNRLSGSIPDSLTSLSSLRFLDLLGNHLSPDSLCKSHSGSLTIRYDQSDGYKCNISPGPPNPSSFPKAAIIAIPLVVTVLAAVIVLACFIRRQNKRKLNVQQVPPYYPEKSPQVSNAPRSGKGHVEHLPSTENRRFTYKELEMFTNNFERLIGKGGFGPVYYGRLEDNTEVAVKTLSESSSHGLDQFLAEVESLTKVHHRNIVSLIGYCWEKDDYLALVYEYMSQGSLLDRLRDKSAAAGTLNWRTRAQIVLEAAQGLDYLHKGCSPPIIHRDVKSGNILLGQNLHAKIADLGLSKTYLSDAQTHLSVTAAGTAGYMDPQYYLTGRLTESSDVYSFGILLLEVATGEPPIAAGYGHIVQRARQMIATGDISSIADAKLGGDYDISSTWKLVDTAMLCTAESPAQRPTMATVVVQLKESLALEEARQEETSTSASRASDITPLASTLQPMAR